MTPATLDRALGLDVYRAGPRTFHVSSASGGPAHVVHGAADTPMTSWQCDCRAAAGRPAIQCSHKGAVAMDIGINIEVPDTATRRRPTTDKLTSSSLQAPGGRPDPAARPAGEIDDTTTGGTMPQTDDLAVFRCYAPARGSVWSQDGQDGEITLRLNVPGADRAAVLALRDALAAGKGRVVQLVPVLTNDNTQGRDDHE